MSILENKSILEKVKKYALSFCLETMNDYPDIPFSKSHAGLVNEDTIMDHIEIVSIDFDNGYDIYAKCQWDKDNDMQIIIKNDQVVYLGPFDGLSVDMSDFTGWNNYVK